MKKLLWDTCSKTAFTFNDKTYKQINIILMGVPFRTALSQCFHDRTRKGCTSYLNLIKRLLSFTLGMLMTLLVFIKKLYKNCNLKTSPRPFCVCKELSTTSIGK